jgi:4-alpha-glucanotransferase
MGEVLDQLALFDALHKHFRAQNPECWSWRDWPTDYQHPSSSLVTAFASAHQDRINYFKYLQWIADEQLRTVAQKAKQLGMPIGLYLDLAVGVDPGGGEAWGDPEMLISEASLGAPPDPLNQLGQNWGLAPINPVALQERGFAPFITALRSNMRHAGALRIDHVMGLLRLYWIPGDLPPTAGVYVRYPFETLLRILALESQRHQCIVIGEDLGTVPEGFRESMADAGLLAYRVLYFERWPDGLFKRADTHPELSLVTVATHDLPTLAGWWLGRDTDLRVKLELYPNAAMKADDIASRPVDRQRLLDALLDAEVITEDALPSQSPPQVTREFLAATQRMLARSQGRIMVVQLEDALGVEEQANVPGTVDEHPNWRRKLPQTVEQIFAHPNVQTVLAVLKEERPRKFYTAPEEPVLEEPTDAASESYDKADDFSRGADTGR